MGVAHVVVDAVVFRRADRPHLIEIAVEVTHGYPPIVREVLHREALRTIVAEEIVWLPRGGIGQQATVAVDEPIRKGHSHETGHCGAWGIVTVFCFLDNPTDPFLRRNTLARTEFVSGDASAVT